jgi:hypothetical protein
MLITMKVAGPRIGGPFFPTAEAKGAWRGPIFDRSEHGSRVCARRPADRILTAMARLSRSAHQGEWPSEFDDRLLPAVVCAHLLPSCLIRAKISLRRSSLQGVYKHAKFHPSPKPGKARPVCL